MNKKHKGRYVEKPGLIDTWECSCGWKSSPYYDGAEYAEQEFEKHLNDPDGTKKKELDDAFMEFLKLTLRYKKPATSEGAG